MKPKKTKKANLENLRTIFFQIGMILALSAILFAFEWKSSVNLEKLSATENTWVDIEDLPPVTRPKEEIPKVRPPAFNFELTKDEFEVPEMDLSHLISEIGVNDPFDIIEFDEPNEKIIEEYVKVEIMPTFQGEDGVYFRNYVASNVKFPASAVEGGVTGTVIASFVIDENGNVGDVKIIRKVHPVIDRAVIKVIEGSPKWEPGIQEGRKVRVRYSIAIAFRLE